VGGVQPEADLAVVDVDAPAAFLAEFVAKLLPQATIVDIEERFPA
jgi:hypothetical protein